MGILNATDCALRHEIVTKFPLLEKTYLFLAALGLSCGSQA